MGESRYAKKPLLYIEQPGIRAPKAEMQSSFRSDSKKEVAQSSKEQSRSAPPQNNSESKRKRNTFHEQLLASPKGRIKPPADEEIEKEDIEGRSKEIKIKNETAESSAIERIEQKENSPEIVHLPFNELDLRGKILYFINKPPLVPVLKCELRTSKQSHFGVIEKFEDDIVHLRKKRKASHELIPFNEIESIRLLGF